MSSYEALEDGIPFSNSRTGRHHFPACKSCSGSVESWSHKHGMHYTCAKFRDICKDAKELQKIFSKMGAAKTGARSSP